MAINKSLPIIAVAVALLLVGTAYLYSQRRLAVNNTASQGQTGTQTLIVEDGQVVGVVDDNEAVNHDSMTDDKMVDKRDIDNGSNPSQPADQQSATQPNNDQPTAPSNPTTPPKADPVKNVVTKQISITGGVKHSVPLDEIIGGGPPKDGIPSIDDPKFVSIANADFITDSEPGIAVSIDGINRFYPFQILVWHEIVNDTFNGKRVLVTYCPLCLSGIVFDPVVKGQRVEFGTSGKLWQSNLVMYDRSTDSYWSQVLGEAIKGEMTGNQLKVLPSDMTRFGEWKKAHPQGQVLSRDTGALRFYGQDPYGDYYTTPGTFFNVRATDNRLKDKDFVLGVVINGKAKAYWPEAIKKAGQITDQFAGKTIVAKYDSDLDATRLFEQKADGTLVRINPFPNFWFSWVAAHPDTELYKG